MLSSGPGELTDVTAASTVATGAGAGAGDGAGDGAAGACELTQGGSIIPPDLPVRYRKRNLDYLEKMCTDATLTQCKFFFATGSLAIGINMPADNVVFLGASSHLTGLTFWQCSVRAGRDAGSAAASLSSLREIP